MLPKNTNIFIIIGRGEIYDEFSIYRNQIYAYSSGSFKSFRHKCSYGLQTYQFMRFVGSKNKFKKNNDKS